MVADDVTVVTSAAGSHPSVAVTKMSVCVGTTAGFGLGCVSASGQGCLSS